MNYEQMTLAELEARQQELTAKRAELQAEGRAVQAAIDAKHAQADVYKMLGNMTDAQRTALAQTVGVQAIPSAAAFGNIGGG